VGLNRFYIARLTNIIFPQTALYKLPDSLLNKVTISGSYSNPPWITDLAQSKITYTGTTAQYLRGDGSIVTFPTLTSGTVTSLGLTSSDITIGGSSPITSSGTYTLTLPVVNSNVGTFNGPYTVNAKGLVTGAVNITYNTPTRVLSTTGSNNTFTISATKGARVNYTINFSVSLLLSNSNGQVDLDYSTDGGSNWINVSSISLVYGGSISVTSNENKILSGEIPPNALARLNRSQNTNTTITLTARQQEVY
jgi:hypothetical protein